MMNYKFVYRITYYASNFSKNGFCKEPTFGKFSRTGLHSTNTSVILRFMQRNKLQETQETLNQNVLQKIYAVLISHIFHGW